MQFARFVIRSRDARLLCGMAVAWLAAGAVSAAMIDPISDLGLYNTGVDDAGAALEGPGTVDPHYVAAISPDPANPGPNAPATAWGVLPIPPWVANTATSRWISAGQGLGVFLSDARPGTYVYETTFDLGTPGDPAYVDPSTLVIMGQWAADDSGVDIRVNGDGAPVNHGSPGFGGFDPFTVSGGFVPGLNVLAFEVSNGGTPPARNPHGVHVQFLGADGTIIPEPASLALMALGFMLMFCNRRM